jgi:hypothetical protein
VYDADAVIDPALWRTYCSAQTMEKISILAAFPNEIT